MNREMIIKYFFLPGITMVMVTALTLDLSAAATRAGDLAISMSAADPEDDDKKQNPPKQDDPEPAEESEDGADADTDDEKGEQKKPATTKTQPSKPELDAETQKNLKRLLERSGANRRSQQDPRTQPGRSPRTGRINPPAGNAPRTTPRRTPTRRTSSPKGARPGAKPGPDVNPEAGETTTLDVAPTLSEVPPEEKIYAFSIADGSYEQLVKAFARQTGLGVIGEAPKDGKVNFVTTEELHYDKAFSRVRMLLRHYKPHDPYYLIRHEKHLEVVRVNDYLRKLPPDRMYRTLEDFRGADLVEDELVLVIYTPKSGTISELRIVRDFMPDYLRVAPIEDRNAVTIFAFVDDINKYFRFKDIFVGSNNDPRTLEEIPIHHILPSEALATLNELMEIDGGRSRPRSPSPRRGAGAKASSRLDNMPEPDVGIWPNDVRGILFVRAMQDKIEEIKLLLPYIDVAQPEGEPVVIPVQHADPAELIQTIQQILVAVSSSPGVSAVKPTRSSSRSKAAKKSPAAASATAGGLTMIVHPSEEAIIAIGDEEEIAEVRKYVAQFDKPSTSPVQIALEHANAVELAAAILVVLSDTATNKRTPARFQLVPDPANEKRLWFRGSNSDLTKVRELVTTFDVPGQGVELHIVNLVHVLPSLMASILTEYDQESAPKPLTTPSSAKKTQAQRRRRPVTVSKFTPDDDRGRLFVFCTDHKWEEYKSLIDDLEKAEESEPLFTRIPVEHLRSEEAIEGISVFFAISGQEGAVRFLPSEGAILVTGATSGQLDDIREILAEIDRPVEIEERTFVIQNKNPADIKMAIETLVADGDTAKSSRRKSSKGPKGATGSSPTILPKLTIIEMGRRLIVRTTPEKMEKVAALVAEFDVDEFQTEMKVYGDFPPGADIGNIADVLKSMRASATPTPRAQKGAAGRSRAAAARFIPQPNLGRLIVIAQPEEFPEIEKFLVVLRTDPGIEPIVIEFVEVQYADPNELVEQITPLLNLKVRELAKGGELDLTLEAGGALGIPSKKRAGPSRGTGDRYQMLGDIRNSRVVVAAEQRIIDEARKLIRQFDRPSKEEEVIVHLVDLKNAEAPSVVKAVKEMRGTPVRPRARKGKGKSTASAAMEVTNLTITEAPGGGAVVLRGERGEVEEVVEWIEQLDARATTGRKIKIYEVAYADIVKLGEFIINTLDTPPARPGAKTSRGRKRIEPEEEEEFTSTKTWAGEHIYIQADLIARTLVVAASPSKIAQIDDYIAQFDAEDSVIPPPPPMPSLTYELKYTDAFDAAFTAEMVIEQLWPHPGELPRVEEAFWGDYLIVKYPYEEHFDEIRELIHKHVDVRDREYDEIVKRTKRTPAKLSAYEAALLLQMKHPELKITIKNMSSGPTEEPLERVAPLKTSAVHPCVLPTAFTHMATRLTEAALLIGEQNAPDDNTEPEPEPASKDRQTSEDDLVQEAVSALMAAESRDPSNEAGVGDGDAREAQEPEPKEVIIRYDDEKRIIEVTGPKGVVTDIDLWLEELESELEDLPVTPDIRVYRVRYIDVNSAADIINEMYNATRQQRQMLQQQARRQQQQARQQALQQQRRQQQQAKDEQQGQGQQPTRGGQRGRQPQQPNVGQLPPTTVRVYPNPRDRTLILRADTSQYPALLDLLATIDQPKPIDSEMRIFHLEKLNAVEVEEMLKDILRLNETPRRSARRGRSRTQQGRATVPVATGGPGAHLPETIMQETKSGGGVLGIDPEDITLHSNEMANTIIAVAPRVALDYIEGIIKQLESEEIRERVARYYELEHAQSDDVASYLETYFAGEAKPSKARQKGKAGGSPKRTGVLTAPTFIPYPRLNMITVLAHEKDYQEIEDIITRLDVRDDRQWEHVVLKHADARAVADTLTQMFTGKRVVQSRKGGGRRAAPSADNTGPVFIGEEGSRMLIFTASTDQRELIQETITRLESEAEIKRTVRIIPVLHAQASQVADAIQTAYGGGSKRGRGRGGQQSSTTFTVTGDDATKTLFVVADDAMFTEIESLVRSLDKPREIGFEFRIYPLTYADARQVHTIMTKLIGDYIRRLGRQAQGMEAFSVEVDDKANAIIALGGPAVFGFIEQNLAIIDTPAYKRSLPGFLMIHLKNGDASEVAQNINRLWGGRNLAPGELQPTAEANRSLNMLIVRGTRDQLDEIQREVIDPLEAQESLTLQSETITLQFAEPEAVAESINQIFEDKARAMKGLGRGTNFPPLEYTVIVTPITDTKQVVVQASEKNLELVKAHIAELDREEIAIIGATAIKIYPVKYADPNAVVNIINQWSRSRSQGGGRQRNAARDMVTAVAEQQTQSVVVSASKANHMIIEELIDGLDDESVAMRQRARHVLKLTHASAAEVANQFTQVFRHVARRSRGDQGPAFVADPKTNSIVANVNDEELVEVQALLAEIDIESPLEANRVTEVYPLRYADPGSVNAVISNMFRGDGRSQPSPSQQVTSHPERTTQSVIVTASVKTHALIRAFIEKVDVESTLTKEFYTYKLQHASADEASRALQQVYRGRRPKRPGDQPVQITSDLPSNSLLIFATQDEMAELSVLIESLDVEPDLTGMQQVKSIHLENADAYVAAEAITRLFRGGRSPRDQVAAIGDHQTSSVIVSASGANLKRIEVFLAEFDSEASAQLRVHVVNLENADADATARTLTEVFIRSAPRPRGGPQPISISAVRGSKALVIKCNDEDFADIQEAMTALDSEAAAGAEEVRVVTLLYGDATEMQRALELTLQKPGGARGKELIGNVKLAPLASSNAMLVSGSKERVDNLEVQIKELDEAAKVSTEPQLIPLTHVRASQILPTLQEMFIEQRGGRTRGQIPTTITSDDTQKVIIVRAPRAAVTAIQSLVQQLDTEEAAGGTNFRIVQLALGVNVTDLSDMIGQAINEGARSRASGKGGRGRQVPTLTVTPDKRTNSLVMSGSPELFDDAEKLARKIEEMGPSSGRVVRVIPLDSVPADELTRLLEQLRDDSSSSRRRSSSSSRKSSGRRSPSRGSRARP